MNIKLRVSSCTLLLALLALATPAWAAKVQVCHVPPGDPSNFHTITIDDHALQAHLAHGDLLGSCNSPLRSALRRWQRLHHRRL